MSRELIAIIEQIEREKGIKKEVLVKAVESALLSAVKLPLRSADVSFSFAIHDLSVMAAQLTARTDTTAASDPTIRRASREWSSGDRLGLLERSVDMRASWRHPRKRPTGTIRDRLM